VNAVAGGDVDPTLSSALHVLAGQVALADQVTALAATRPRWPRRSGRPTCT